MNSGSIEFSEYKWIRMTPDEAINFMLKIESKFVGMYQMIKRNSNIVYLVGESEEFLSPVINGAYPIYTINDDLTLKLTLGVLRL